ncbi:[protein-PII] uridylyltransferase [Thiohalorhabdus sp.]|uniref:[protein-PII] uridylyltransferase n=1 Tax=Thiohalorhabdus sp. TaxID=3094134 RepID=UPI002FC2F6B8
MSQPTNGPRGPRKPGDQPVYRLRHRQWVFPERRFARDLEALRDEHPPEAGWEPARLAYLDLFRDAYRQGRDFLRQRYEIGASGREIVRGHALLTDRLLQNLWRMLADYLAHERRRMSLCLAAVGGYGRAELHPHSDVDLLLLHGDTAEVAAAFAEPLLHFLWDVGLPVSQALRTPEQCVGDAHDDLTIQTSLLEARLLAGDEDLYGQFHDRFRAEALIDGDAFTAAKQEEQRIRHARYGGPVYNLEPNVKESWGGLRDIQLLYWVARYRFDVASLRELMTRGILTAAECRALTRAQEFLWRVRNGLHYAAGRNENRLLFDHQHELAAEFGYRDGTATLAVEKFMKRYYRSLRQVVALTNIGLRTLEQALHGPPVRQLGPELALRGAYLEAVKPEHLTRDPAGMVPFFVEAQEREPLSPLGAETLRALWTGARAVDASVRGDARVRSGLLRILTRPGRVAKILRPMNTYGVLGRLVPEFGRIVGQTQHNLFHIYPVDEHTLRAMEIADAFFRQDPEVTGDSPLACRLAPQVRRPEVLYLGLMCHDIAKGQAGDHSVLGARVARRLARRLGMDAEDAETAAWLVHEHLSLSQISQKRDIHDPEIIGEVAARVGTAEHLDLLFLLTEADMRATGPKVWNTWKAQLLGDLYANTRQALHAGNPGDARERARRMQRRISQALAEEGFDTRTVRAHLKRVDRDYLLHYHPEELIQHTRTLVNPAQATVVEVAPHSRAGGTEILLYTPDRPGLFTLVTGVLAALGLNILEAKIHTTRDFWALDTFLVLDQEDQPVADPAARANLRERLQAALTQPGVAPSPPGRQTFRERAQRHFPTPVQVTFYPSASGQQTVAEVVAPDIPGVLHRIAGVLSEQGCEIHAAKVATFGERTEDTFFITREGMPLDAPEARQALARAVREELEPQAVSG